MYLSAISTFIILISFSTRDVQLFLRFQILDHISLLPIGLPLISSIFLLFLSVTFHPFHFRLFSDFKSKNLFSLIRNIEVVSFSFFSFSKLLQSKINSSFLQINSILFQISATYTNNFHFLMLLPTALCKRISLIAF